MSAFESSRAERSFRRRRGRWALDSVPLDGRRPSVRRVEYTDSTMKVKKRTHLERQQGRRLARRSRSLGEDEDADAFRLHDFADLGELSDGGFAIGSIDPNGVGEGHELSKEGCVAERLFGHDGASLGEESADCASE